MSPLDAYQTPLHLEPKPGLSPRVVMGVVALVLTMVGALAGFYLLQIQQDVRQQAKDEPYDLTCVQLCLKTVSGDSLQDCQRQCPAKPGASKECLPSYTYHRALDECVRPVDIFRATNK